MAKSILKGARGIAEHAELPEREIRHLIDKHGLPHTKRGRAIYSTVEQVDRYFGGNSDQ